MDKAVDNPEQQSGAAPEQAQGAPAGVAAPDGAGADEPAAASAQVEAAKDSARDEPAAEERAGSEPEVGAEPAAAAAGGPVEAASDPAGAPANDEPQTAVASAVPAAPVAAEAAPLEAEPATSGKPHKRVLTGTVVSNGSEQSVVIRIARRKKHRLYKKYRTLTKKVMAHDPANDCRVGDVVRVVESRPLSRMKRWRLVEIVKRGS